MLNGSRTAHAAVLNSPTLQSLDIEDSASTDVCVPRLSVDHFGETLDTKDLERAFDSKAGGVVWVEWERDDPENPFNVRTTRRTADWPHEGSSGSLRVSRRAVESTEKVANHLDLLCVYSGTLPCLRRSIARLTDIRSRSLSLSRTRRSRAGRLR